MPTKITPLAPAECKLCAVKQRPKKCVSFNTTNAHHLAGNPLISGGGPIDIGIMPRTEIQIGVQFELFRNTALKGDSGGPLLANNGTNFVQIGVLSGYIPFKNQSAASAAAEIRHYSQLDGRWIQRITGTKCAN
uniref:Peptidase S1 domain-containing protein n=1 Tax=Globodera pallida TaxID=36090 RepID=A0A183BSC6_GLOPA